MKILLYGLGRGHLIVEKYLKEKHEIVGYVDEFLKEKEYNGVSVYTKECIKNLDKECIVKAI